ncbi:hypothetical protein D3C80_1406820 [compost metagenome]
MPPAGHAFQPCRRRPGWVRPLHAGPALQRAPVATHSGRVTVPCPPVPARSPEVPAAQGARGCRHRCAKVHCSWPAAVQGVCPATAAQGRSRAGPSPAPVLWPKPAAGWHCRHGRRHARPATTPAAYPGVAALQVTDQTRAGHREFATPSGRTGRYPGAAARAPHRPVALPVAIHGRCGWP